MATTDQPKSAPAETLAPYPGSKKMPRWDLGELPDAPHFTWKNWAGMLGPGLVMGAAAIGGGEWLLGPLVTARFGGALFWLPTISILAQVIYNIEISRYTLYSGEPIFTGKFRIFPGPLFWLTAYLVLDLGSIFPYLASHAATPLFMMMKGVPPGPADKILMKELASLVLVGTVLPLAFGRKVYSTLKAIMSIKLALVLGFLLVLGLFFSTPGTWKEIFTGFVKFGNVPVQKGEDLNGNGKLDPGEDFDNDGHLDVVEKWDKSHDKNKNGVPDKGEFVDVDGDGKVDGDNVENVFVSLFEKHQMPVVDLTMLSVLAALFSIAGSGGLTNTSISAYTRDQGWGMGAQVGAIPSFFGGHELSLSHVGKVFRLTPESIARFNRWRKHVFREQFWVWMPACFLGLALPSMLSVQFLKRGTRANDWEIAGMTAKGVMEAVSLKLGPNIGNLFWYLTLLCGLLVLAPTMTTTADGVLRRWVDVCWTGLPAMRKWDSRHIGTLYFGGLCAFMGFGLFMLWLVPDPKAVLLIATMMYNYAFGVSCLHTLAVNRILLPKELRPNWLNSTGLLFSGVFFLALSVFATVNEVMQHR